MSTGTAIITTFQPKAQIQRVADIKLQLYFQQSVRLLGSLNEAVGH